MKTFNLVILLFFTIILSGCSDQFSQLKEAVAGINSKANDAATSLSEDAHALRSVQLSMGKNSPTVTVNELFKTILRDVQWFYNESNPSTIQIKGTYRKGLFENSDFTSTDRKNLEEKGKVIITLYFHDLDIVPHETSVEMRLDHQVIVQEAGENALLLLYDAYNEK